LGFIFSFFFIFLLFIIFLLLLFTLEKGKGHEFFSFFVIKKKLKGEMAVGFIFSLFITFLQG